MDKKLWVSYFNLQTGYSPHGKSFSDTCEKPHRRSKSRMPLSPNAQRRLMNEIQRGNRWSVN